MQNFSVLFMGMLGELSRQPLATLLEAGVQVCGVVMPGSETDDPDPISLDAPDFEDLAEIEFVPMVSQYLSPSVITLAWEHHLPLLSIRDLARPASYAALAAWQPDVICVSCFSQIIPPAILSLPKLGAINLHPSLLPAYRGPWPLFWQFYHSEPRTGVTLHFLNERLDAGDILLQAEVPFADGITGDEAEQLCAQAGGQLLVKGLNLIRAGNPPRRPQNEADSSYQPIPNWTHLAIRPDQPARRAFNFMRGASTLIGQASFEIIVGEASFRTREALDYSAEADLGAAYRREADRVSIQFNPGVVTVKVLA